MLKLEDVVLTKDVLSENAKRQRSTISQYFSNLECLVDCGRQAKKKLICEECKKEPQRVALVLSEKIHRIERKFRQVEEICASCCGRPFAPECSSLDCPILYTRTKCYRKHQQIELLSKCLDMV